MTGCFQASVPLLTGDNRKARPTTIKIPDRIDSPLLLLSDGSLPHQNATRRREYTSAAEMRRRIKLTTRRELTAAISQRYQTADAEKQEADPG